MLKDKENNISPEIIDYFIVAYSVMLLLSIERKALDSIWWLLRFFHLARDDLSRFLAKNAETWEQVCIDYLCGIQCACYGVRLHTPMFKSYADKILIDVQKGFEKSICSKAEHQATQFMNTVFPDIPTNP